MNPTSETQGEISSSKYKSLSALNERISKAVLCFRSPGMPDEILVTSSVCEGDTVEELKNMGSRMWRRCVISVKSVCFLHSLFLTGAAPCKATGIVTTPGCTASAGR